MTVMMWNVTHTETAAKHSSIGHLLNLGYPVCYCSCVIVAKCVGDSKDQNTILMLMIFGKLLLGGFVLH